MKRIILASLLLVYVSGWIESCDNPPKSDSPCDAKLWKHTYGTMKRFANPPERKFLRHRCVTVTGTVGGVSEERDGDLKIKLNLARENYKPDGPFNGPKDILNNKNAPGVLVVEVVCAVPHKIFEAQSKDKPENRKYYQEMIDACTGYTNRVARPVMGDTIAVTGELMADTGPSTANSIQDHGWNEIHPVTSIQILTKPKGTLTERR
jgi:hypothetical protein